MDDANSFRDWRPPSFPEHSPLWHFRPSHWVVDLGPAGEGLVCPGWFCEHSQLCLCLGWAHGQHSPAGISQSVARPDWVFEGKCLEPVEIKAQKAHYWAPSLPPRNFLGLNAHEAGHGVKLQVTLAGRVVASLISVSTTATMLCHGSLSSRAQFPEALRKPRSEAHTWAGPVHTFLADWIGGGTPVPS